MATPETDHLTLGAWDLGLTRWAGAGRAVVALHGFTGSGQDFAPFAPLLGRPCLAPDLPGHGATRGPETFSLAATIELLGHALDAWSLSLPPVLLGYSLGGRLALNLALACPQRFAALVLIGASPGVRAEEARAERRTADDALADRIETEGVTWFSEWWASRPVIRSQDQIAEPHLAAMRARRRGNRAQGLAASLRGLGTGVLAPRWDALAPLRLPTLLVTGQRDTSFCSVAASMLEALPQAEQAVIADAGHCAHLERPQQVALRVDGYLRERGL